MGKYVHMVAFFASPLGGDVEKLGIFKMGKYVHMVTCFNEKYNYNIEEK